MRSINSILDGILEKKNLEEGFARPTKNRNNYTADLEKISTNLYENLTPAALRFRV